MSKSTNLKRRIDFFKQELAWRASLKHPTDRSKFEIAAIEWAIPILEDEAEKIVRELNQNVSSEDKRK